MQLALVHHVALVPTIIGSMAALGQPIVFLNALAGLGFAFTSNTAKAHIIHFGLERLLKWLLNRKLATVLVQNPGDRTAMQSLGVSGGEIVQIAGSGRKQILPSPHWTGDRCTVSIAPKVVLARGLAIAAVDASRINSAYCRTARRELMDRNVLQARKVAIIDLGDVRLPGTIGIAQIGAADWRSPR